jgi:hypothetical protein
VVPAQDTVVDCRALRLFWPTTGFTGRCLQTFFVSKASSLRLSQQDDQCYTASSLTRHLAGLATKQEGSEPVSTIPYIYLPFITIWQQLLFCFCRITWRHCGAQQSPTRHYGGPPICGRSGNESRWPRQEQILSIYPSSLDSKLKPPGTLWRKQCSNKVLHYITGL